MTARPIAAGATVYACAVMPLYNCIRCVSATSLRASPLKRFGGVHGESRKRRRTCRPRAHGEASGPPADRLHSPVQAVSGVAEAGDDVALLVELLVEGAEHDRDV